MAGQLYSEPLRPQFHFTADRGWLNDPNGLVYSNGEYHLFFQHDPDSTAGNHKFWGHAVSKDLIHWKQLPEAIEPDALGDIWSGSAVVDPHNTAGLGKDALICIYTAAGGTNDASKGKPFTQCLVYSLDGRIFRRFKGNPVLGHIEAENRDPKLVWYEPTHSWVLALYLNGNHYALFTSPDLKTWTKSCEVDMPHAGECPDFFEMPLGKEKKWVFSGASGYYRVGRFDGKTFTPETDSTPFYFGNTGYAAQTFFNDPKGRRIQITWFNNSNFPGVAWNQQMGFPTDLKLVSTTQGPRLMINPVDEVRSLWAAQLKGSDGWYPCTSGLMDISIHATVPASGVLNLTINGHSIAYDASTRKLDAFGREVEIQPQNGRLDLRMLVDRCSIEIYAQGGLVYMPFFALPAGDEHGLRVDADFHVDRIDVHEFRSAWLH